MQSFLTSSDPAVVGGPDTLQIRPDPSIGISEIRTVQSFLSKKPIQSDHNTVIIHEAHLLTPDAQQAFLKTLEEPPANALIYLVTSFPDQLIPTILSRVQIISSPDMTNLSHVTDLTYQEFFQKLLSVGVGERLVLLDQQDFTRESALTFLDDLEQIIHSGISTGTPPLESRGGRGSYELILETRKYLKANVSVRLALDNFVINL
jgi:hypothetical protein